jgi:hypothetical protein
LNYESGGASTSLKKALASMGKEAWDLTVRVDREVCSQEVDVMMNQQENTKTEKF